MGSRKEGGTTPRIEGGGKLYFFYFLLPLVIFHLLLLFVVVYVIYTKIGQGLQRRPPLKMLTGHMARS
jgi:hypothetical protein